MNQEFKNKADAVAIYGAGEKMTVYQVGIRGVRAVSFDFFGHSGNLVVRVDEDDRYFLIHGCPMELVVCKNTEIDGSYGMETFKIRADEILTEVFRFSGVEVSETLLREPLDLSDPSYSFRVRLKGKGGMYTEEIAKEATPEQIMEMCEKLLARIVKHEAIKGQKPPYDGMPE